MRKPGYLRRWWIRGPRQPGGAPLAALVLLALARCDVFDEGLIPTTDAAAVSFEAGLPGDDAFVTASPAIDVSGECESAPLLASLPNVPLPLRITDGTCGGSPPSVVSCLDGPLGGHTLYFSFQSALEVGNNDPQTWHVSLRDKTNTAGDIALYILNGCATSSCSDLNAGVRSTTYKDLSFRVTPGQKYIVAVNTAGNDPCDTSNLPRVLLQRDRCMDDIVENGEACDPPNPSCLGCQYVVLTANSQDSEPNDSPLQANIIPVGPTPFDLTGTVTQGQPDMDGGGVAVTDPYDFFRLQAPSNAVSPTMLHVTLKWHEPLNEGGACADAYFAAIYLSEKWYDPSSIGHSGMRSSPPVGGPDPDGAPLIECTTSLDLTFDPDTQSSIPGLSRYILRVAAGKNKRVDYELSVVEAWDQ